MLTGLAIGSVGSWYLVDVKTFRFQMKPDRRPHVQRWLRAPLPDLARAWFFEKPPGSIQRARFGRSRASRRGEDCS
jgi:hypothetical protein